MRLNAVAKVVISTDESGMIEYWRADDDFDFPADKVKFALKSDTDLFEFAKHKAVPWGLDVSPNGKYWATVASDRKVRLFAFATGKLLRVYVQCCACSIPKIVLHERSFVVIKAHFCGALLWCRYDESIDAFTASDSGGSLDMMELGRKVASERELLRSPAVRRENVVFDESSNFLL